MLKANSERQGKCNSAFKHDKTKHYMNCCQQNTACGPFNNTSNCLNIIEVTINIIYLYFALIYMCSLSDLTISMIQFAVLLR